MKRKRMVLISTLLILLASLFTTVAAQTGVEPSPEPEEEPLTGYVHPVVKVLSAYFDREMAGEPDPDVTPDPSETPDPAATPEAGEGEESVLGPIGEEIASLHEQGMGFGVLVKLYAMAEEAALTCAQSEKSDCAGISAGELVAAFQSGTGMGQLFKEYGKPALLGVGHVKQELKEMEAAEAQAAGESSAVKNNGKPDNKPPKVKTNNGKGSKK
ncbi:hypothetical protein EG834_18435 [bacterium]|nr:hypothetical protein [bacterium]